MVVATSGKSGHLVGLVIARGLAMPPLMAGRAALVVAVPIFTCPPEVRVTACAPPWLMTGFVFKTSTPIAFRNCRTT